MASFETTEELNNEEFKDFMIKLQTNEGNLYPIEASSCTGSGLIKTMINQCGEDEEEEEDEKIIPLPLVFDKDITFILEFFELYSKVKFDTIQKPIIGKTLEENLPIEWVDFMRRYKIIVNLEEKTSNYYMSDFERMLEKAVYIDCEKMKELICCFIASNDGIGDKSILELKIICQNLTMMKFQIPIIDEQTRIEELKENLVKESDSEDEEDEKSNGPAEEEDLVEVSDCEDEKSNGPAEEED